MNDQRIVAPPFNTQAVSGDFGVNNNMVYDSKTFKVLHRLTPEGEVEYGKMLEIAADDLLFKAQHPVKWFFQKAAEFFVSVFCAV